MNNKNDIRRLINLLVIVFIGYLIITNLKFIISIINNIVDAFAPFLLGVVLAFILNIPMKKLEGLFESLQKNKDKKIKTRGISIFLSLIIFFALIIFIVIELVPDLISNIELLIKNIPNILTSVEGFALDLVKDYPEVQNKIKDLFLNTGNVNDILMNILNYLINGSINFVSSFVNSVVTVFTAFVFAVYMLLQKENLIKGAKTILKAYLGDKKSKKVIEIGRLSNDVFSKFVSGQCLESAILGLIFFVILSLCGFPYSLLISVLVAITSLIPFFGAFIALVIGAILIATQSFTQAIIFVLIFLVTQQIENNLIYPKVVGKSVGLSPLWTLLAITVGGSIFGIVGMIIGLPIASILYALLKKDIKVRIDKRNLLVD